MKKIIGISLALLLVSFSLTIIFPYPIVLISSFIFNLLLVLLTIFLLGSFRILYYYWPVVGETIFLLLSLNIFWLTAGNYLIQYIFLFICLAIFGLLFYNFYTLNFSPRVWRIEWITLSAPLICFLITYFLFFSVNFLIQFLGVSQVGLFVILFISLSWLSLYNFYTIRLRYFLNEKKERYLDLTKDKKINFFLVFIFSLLGIESLIVCNFLPFGTFVNSFLASVFYVLSFNIPFVGFWVF